MAISLVTHFKLEGYRACAGAILTNKRREVLICRRNTDEYICWQFPQGGVEEGETFQEAALREADEELSLTACKNISGTELPKFLETIPVHYYDVPEGTWLSKAGFKGQAICFSIFEWLGEPEKLDLSISHDEGAPPEFAEAKWMPVDRWDVELAPFVHEFKKELYQVLREKVFAAVQ